MLRRYVTQVRIRLRSSAMVFSVSGCDGAFCPERYAAAYLAWSHADCTWRTSSYWSGASRDCVSTSGSNFLVPACATPTSSQRSRLSSIRANWVIVAAASMAAPYAACNPTQDAREQTPTPRGRHGDGPSRPWLEHDDRYPPRRDPLVLREERVHRRQPRPECGVLGGGRGTRDDGHDARAHLHGRLGPCAQVRPPRWRPVGATVRCHDDEPLAVCEVGERHRPRLPAAPPRRGQQEVRDPPRAVTDPSTGGAIERRVDATRHAPGRTLADELQRALQEVHRGRHSRSHPPRTPRGGFRETPPPAISQDRWTGSHDALANRCDRDTGVVIRSVLAAGLLARVRPALDTAALDEPIRAELFSVERLEQHAESLAAAQKVARNPRVGLSLARRVRDNGRVLLECYRLLAEASREEGSITPAAEWLVDNYYIVDEQLRDIRDHLPRGFYRELPKLAEGHLAGYPRVLGLAWAFVAHTDSRFDPDVLRRFVQAYQRVEPLLIGELWAVAITLRIVLVENLVRLAERIVSWGDAS